jgi:hypothetical protein|tara:strand:+ start:2072 stop:2305 length:234 start_codon:yes stop_codon:yes gene_type:complete
MNKFTDKHDGAIWRCLYRLVRWFGPTWCWVGMMMFILTANSRAAGVDALLVAFFAMGFGFLSANVKGDARACECRAC